MSENEKYLIGRQPILNRSEQTVAYELLFRSAASLSAAQMKNASHATASVILHTISNIGIREILGDKQGFINVDSDLLMSDSIEIIPRELVGLDLLGSIDVNQEVVQRCRSLKERGFTLALDDHGRSAQHEELYGLVDMIKIDLAQTPVERLHELVDYFRRFPSKLVAEKVDSSDSFKMCARLGFDYFQGYFFARPSLIEKKGVDENCANLLQILRLLIAESTMTEIEQVFRRSPTLTYKLLLLVNSVSMGVREKIRDVRHALTILGRQQIKRWVQLGLFASGGESRDSDNPLIEMASVRAAFMEQTAAEIPALKGNRSAADQAFMIGILSLLENIYNISIDEIATSLNLSDEVRSALVERKGVFGRLLELTEMLESHEQAAAEGLQELGIPLDGVIAAQIRSLSRQQTPSGSGRGGK